MATTELLIVRHPETVANVEGRFVGRGESPYSPLGRRQARRLPVKIAAFAPDAVRTSPLLRARFVAEKAAARAGVPLMVDERLVELDFGQAEGLTYEEIAAAGMTFDYRDDSAPVAPGGESRAALEARVTAAAADAVAAGGRIALVAHGGVVRALLAHLLGLSARDIWAFHVHNAQLARVRVIDGHGLLEEYVQG